MTFFRSVNGNGALLLATSLVFALPIPVSQAYTSEQAQKCTGDAMRLCGAEIPDVDRITACMVKKRAQLSEGCRAVFRQEPSDHTTSVNYDNYNNSNNNNNNNYNNNHYNKPPKSGWRNYWGWGD